MLLFAGRKAEHHQFSSRKYFLLDETILYTPQEKLVEKKIKTRSVAPPYEPQSPQKQAVRPRPGRVYWKPESIHHTYSSAERWRKLAH